MIILHGELDGEKREAWFSECGVYRYLFEIVWDSSLPMMTTIALNPSKASHLVNDNTIVRCKKFARLRGFGGYRMLNAFALRSTNPKQLFVAKDPVGRENTIEFLTAHRTPMTIAAWGATIQSRRWKYWYRGHEIAGAIRDLMCFKKTAEGHPFHPLYLSWDVEPVPFSYGIETKSPLHVGGRAKIRCGPTRARLFKGVYPTPSGKWQAQLGVAGRRLYLGMFISEKDAARAYNEAALEYFGSDAYLNPVND